MMRRQLAAYRIAAAAAAATARRIRKRQHQTIFLTAERIGSASAGSAAWFSSSQGIGFNSLRRFSSSSSVRYDGSSASFFSTSAATLQEEEKQQDASSSKAFFTAEQRVVMEECRRLHETVLVPLNDKIRGPLFSSPTVASGGGAAFGGHVALPTVLLLGNHSSGKSSFLNYVAGRRIQTTGVAPTDDAFTLVAPGPVDSDQDGPAVINDPDLGFQPLQQFGPTLLHHVQLKIRRNLGGGGSSGDSSNNNHNFLLIDTPGMIDAPGNYAGLLEQQPSGDGSSSNSSADTMDRGYDFTGVVAWLADRADVVLLFFDPDKPGTTGETLQVLLHALTGLDHKLLLVLNKADQCSDSIHDFARAYGSLCWNLSKVIPRKDLPRIYTMCLPVEDDDDTDDKKTEASTQQTTTASNAATLQDLWRARDEVVAAVRKAPARRLDNWITSLHDHVQQLHLYASVVQELQARYSHQYWHHKRQEVLAAVTGCSLTAMAALYGPELVAAPGSNVVGMVVAALASSTVLGTGGMAWYQAQQLQAWQEQQGQSSSLFQTFAKTHAGALQQQDEYVAALWQRHILPTLERVLQNDGSREEILQGNWVTPKDLQQLQTILQQDIPRLRRLAAPPHYGQTDTTSTPSGDGNSSN